MSGINVQVNINSNVNASSIANQLNNDQFGLFMSQSVHKHYFLAMPAKTTDYSTLIDFKPWEYTHKVPYAEEVYTKNKNYRTEIHPFAMANYIEGYAGVAMPRIEQDYENYVRRYMYND